MGNAKRSKRDRDKQRQKAGTTRSASPLAGAVQPMAGSAAGGDPAAPDRYALSTGLDDLPPLGEGGRSAPLARGLYEQELTRLQVELVKMQYWLKEEGKRLILVFEGRDAAGKGGTIKRITEPLNPRGCRVAALGTPSDHQKTQWYFQRYVEHFPSAGEIVLFDRSWYNRAGVERVMGFCTEADVQEFMLSCPEFERMLVRSGITLIKYWFSVSAEEQEARFRSRLRDPARRWKLSAMDLASRDRWDEFSRAKDAMFAHTNIPEAPWYTVEADDKRRARLNCLRHLLSKVPYRDLTPKAMELPPRPSQAVDPDVPRSPRYEQFFVPNAYP